MVPGNYEIAWVAHHVGADMRGQAVQVDYAVAAKEDISARTELVLIAVLIKQGKVVSAVTQNIIEPGAASFMIGAVHNHLWLADERRSSEPAAQRNVHVGQSAGRDAAKGPDNRQAIKGLQKLSAHRYP